MKRQEKLLIKTLVKESVEKSIRYYGLEGCEEAICRVYTSNPTIKRKMLAYLKLILKK